MKSLKKLGKVLNKQEQKSIRGGVLEKNRSFCPSGFKYCELAGFCQPKKMPCPI